MADPIKEQRRQNLIRGSQLLPKSVGEQDIFRMRVTEYTTLYKMDPDDNDIAYMMAQRAFINDRLDTLTEETAKDLSGMEARQVIHKLILLVREVNNA